MTRQDGRELGRDAHGRRRRKVVDPAAAGPRPEGGSARDPADAAANLAGWPAQAGSRSGEFTLVLANQVCRALFMSEDPRLASVQFEAAAAALEEIGPRDPIEGMLAGQIVAAHDAAMLSLHLASRNGVSHELRDRTLNQANKLMRSCAALVEALGRHRKPPEQVVRVERVTVEAGGQAIVGPVSHRGVRGVQEEPTNNPMHSRVDRLNRVPRCGAKTRAGSPCRSPAVKGKRRCRMHGAHAGAPEGNRNALKHGARTAAAMVRRREVRELLRAVRDLLD